jgi:uncharacterized protein
VFTGASRPTRILLRLALYSGALFVAIPLSFSYVMTRAERPRALSSPAPGYQELVIACEGLRLRAWLWTGTPERPAIVIVHGLSDSLESYLEHAQPFQQRGHTVLLLDLRAHGGSQGTLTTLGGREKADVTAAMDELRKRGLARAGIVLMGHSMGAVAVLLAAADVNDVRGVIAEAPYDTYRNTIVHHARLLYGLPPWVPLIPVAIAITEWRADFRADDVDCVAAARRIRAPLLAIVDGNDARMTEEIVRRIYDAHPGPKALWVAAGAYHVGAILRPEHWPRILSFLETNGL